jgi:hypothetical protein
MWKASQLPQTTLGFRLITTGKLTGNGKPSSVAKASKAATSPAEAAPLTPWLKFADRSAKSVPLANSEPVIDARETWRPH